MLLQIKVIFEKPVRILVGRIRAYHTRTEKVSFSEKKKKMTRGRMILLIINLASNSSGIPLTFKAVESGFRTNAASSTLSSGKYRLKLVSRD